MTEIAETESTAEYWRNQIELWQTSGTSQAMYCKTHALRYCRFLYWRRKFEQPTTVPGSSSPTAGFARVAVQKAKADLSISLPSGLVVPGISADNLPVVHQLLTRLS